MTNKKTLWRRIARDRQLIYLALPTVVVLLLFYYLPMGGVVMAFQDFRMKAGIFGSRFVGLTWFKDFMSSIFFPRLIRNTLLISLFSLVVNLPFAVLFAIQLNELRDGPFKRFVQSASYFPYFISTVVVVGMLISFLNPQDGIINQMLNRLGFDSIHFMSEASWFRPIYVISGLWQSFGWNAIIYIGAISGIDPALYEAAVVDGANVFQKIRYITFPSIRPVIITVLLLSMGNILNVGFEKIILMYSPTNYETADVISTYVYRMGIQNAQYSFGAAVGLFNSVVNTAFILSANFLGKKLTGVKLW